MKQNYRYTENLKTLSVWGVSNDLYQQDFLPDVTELHLQKASELGINYSLFPSVKTLWIDTKHPYSVPDSFLQLEQLDKLIVSAYCYLPANIHQLKNLRELWLNDDGAVSVPANITKAESVKELVISYYDNIEPAPVPEWIFDMPGLEKLTFSVNRFTEISPKINQLTGLKELDFGCSFSNLDEFPDLSGLTRLKRLSVASESVQGQKLPKYALFAQILEGIKNLTGLEHLDLSGWKPRKKTDCTAIINNQISIPDVFARHPVLNELALCGMNIEVVPESVLQLKQLKKLSLNNNKLTNNEVKRVIEHLPYCAIDSDIVCYKPRKK